MRTLTNTELTHLSGGTTLSNEDQISGIMGVLAGVAVGNCVPTTNKGFSMALGGLIGGLVGLFGSVYGSTQCPANLSSEL